MHNKFAPNMFPSLIIFFGCTNTMQAALLRAHFSSDPLIPASSLSTRSLRELHLWLGGDDTTPCSKVGSLRRAQGLFPYLSNLLSANFMQWSAFRSVGFDQSSQSPHFQYRAASLRKAKSAYRQAYLHAPIFNDSAAIWRLWCQQEENNWTVDEHTLQWRIGYYVSPMIVRHHCFLFHQ